MADRTVLVVEDDVVIRDLVVQVLGSEGFEAVPAGNGAEALRRLRGSVHPAVILLDLMMPVMNGWQFRAEQLRDPALADIPVVVMSAADDGGIPADGHVHKPFEIDALLDAVARFAPGPPRPTSAPA
jgi:CheY-like chemotaxis protein